MRLSSFHLPLILSLVMVMQFWAPSCGKTEPARFFELMKHAVDNAATVRVFKLGQTLLADNPRLTIRDIPDPQSERSFDKNDERLRFIIDLLSKESSYDFQFMISMRTRVQYGIIFFGPSEMSALLIPLPTASQSAAVTVRFVAEHPMEISSSTALLADAASLISNMERVME